MYAHVTTTGVVLHQPLLESQVSCSSLCLSTDSPDFERARRQADLQMTLDMLRENHFPCGTASSSLS